LLQGRWYCCLDCFEDAITGVFNSLLRLPDEPLPHLHRVPLGLLLLGRGVITDSQLKSALQAQREGGTDRLGKWLVRLGVASAQDVSAALAAQWGCAVFPIERDQHYRECSQMLPFALLEASQMIPVHYLPSSQLLFVAFSEDIDHTALYAVERLIGGHTEPCIVSESAMKRALEEIRTVSRPAEIVFETLWDAPEMARTIRDYAVKLNADELILGRPRRFLWVRLRASGRSWDLLFRLPAGKIAERAAMSR
jgi:nucleotide-binding universal stress UspA family protein